MMRRNISLLFSRREGNRQLNQEWRGFTLIELLTVVVVIGVVSTVAAMALGRLNEKSMSAACQTDGTKIYERHLVGQSAIPRHDGQASPFY